MASSAKTRWNLRGQLRNLVLGGPLLIAIDVRLAILVIYLLTDFGAKPLQVWGLFLSMVFSNALLLWDSRRNRLEVDDLQRWYLLDSLFTAIGLGVLQGMQGWSSYLVIYAAVSASLYMLIAEGMLPFLLGPAFIFVTAFVTRNSQTDPYLEVLAQYLLILFGQILGIIIRRNFLNLVEATERAAHDREINLLQEERLEMSRELHDSLVKTVHGTEMIAASTLQTLREENSAALPQMEAIREACRKSSAEAREVLSGLRTISQQDLQEAIVFSVEQFSAQGGIEITLKMDDEIPAVNHEVQWTFLKVLNESLENVRRHSHAKKVCVEVRETEGVVGLQVSDDGVGLPTKKLADYALHGHFGLLGMRERAEALGGNLHISSQTGKGTQVLLEIPRENELRKVS